MWWMLMGVLILGFTVALFFVDESRDMCVWCGNRIPGGEEKAFRRPYRLDLLETRLYGVNLYCSRRCLDSHSAFLRGEDDE